MKRFLLGLLALAVIAGVVVLAVMPTVGSQYRLWRDADAVSNYRQAVDALDTLACGTRLAQARRYNAGLTEIALWDAFAQAGEAGDGEAAREDPDAEPLDAAGSGVIAVLEIPKLGATLPVYRELSANVLARGAAHLAGTSLPVGGEGTHAVLAGQGDGRFSGLLDGLDRLIPGDVFYVQALQDTLVYEVTEAQTLAPEALEPLAVEAGADLCTLMTAPSEGERLLVQARRIGRRETPLEDDTQALPGWAARLIFAAPVALAGLIALALIEGMRRAVTRRRLKRMKL